MLKKIAAFVKSVWYRKTIKAASALAGKKMALKDLTPELKIGVRIHKRIPFMVEDYHKLVKYTGGMVSNSMAIAYERGLRDIVKLLVPRAPSGPNPQRKH